MRPSPAQRWRAKDRMPRTPPKTAHLGRGATRNLTDPPDRTDLSTRQHAEVGGVVARGERRGAQAEPTSLPPKLPFQPPPALVAPQELAPMNRAGGAKAKGAEVAGEANDHRLVIAPLRPLRPPFRDDPGSNRMSPAQETACLIPSCLNIRRIGSLE